jgi:hypothetical protein
MIPKEKLVKLLSGMYFNNTGQLASKEYLESKSWADLQAIYDGEIQRAEKKLRAAADPAQVAARIAADETTRELEEERIRMANEKWKAEQNPPPSPAENRKIFSQVCRQCGIAENEANFSILVQRCNGDLFDAFTAGQVVKKNPGSYVAASPAEQSQWAAETAQATQEAYLAHQKYLRNCTPAQLREAAAGEQRAKAEGRIVTQNGCVVLDVDPRSPAQIALEKEICIAFELETHFPDLPATWNNQPLTSKFIRDAEAKTLRNLLQRFGRSRVTARLHGIKFASADFGDRKVRYEVDKEIVGVPA